MSINITTYTDFRKNLASHMDKVNQDHVPMIITRQNGSPAVLMSLDDFNGYSTTEYLFASPENAKRLEEFIAQAEAGNVIERDLIEVDDDE